MITFSELGRHGRLGNQLFQYAALKSIALENGYVCKIPNPAAMEWHGQKCLLSEFNIEASFLEPHDLSSIERNVIEPSHHYFFKDFFHIPDNSNIHGYFQSTYYFNKHKDQICKELTPAHKYISKANEFLNFLRADGSEVVSIHLRRGDNIDGTNLNEKYLSFYGKNDIYDKDSIYGQYISQALAKFGDRKVKFLVFSGGSRTGDDKEDILWAKNTFKKENFFVSETNSAMEDFSLMMLCDHNITCHLTTFGWWAAYLNPNPNKTIIAPKNYFYDEKEEYVRPGFFPASWTII